MAETPFAGSALTRARAACQHFETTEEETFRWIGVRDRLGIPGRFPGKVVAVSHARAHRRGQYQAGPIHSMLGVGMRTLTGLDDDIAAWSSLFEPSDTVGIKLNAVARPYLISSPVLVREIIGMLLRIGIKTHDIVVYDRYRLSFKEAGFDTWLPEGVRWTAASERVQPYQMDMEGYDRDQYVQISLVHPIHTADFSLDDPHIQRSYVCRFLAREVNKVINLSVLKHHRAAGVSLALKNLSHGFVNNVSRSHVTTTANACGVFIPTVVGMPIIRRKVVLNIVDGIRGAYHGGPGPSVQPYIWSNNTLYFSTDPVALDKTAWRDIDERRARAGMPSVSFQRPDSISEWLHCQVEHIELAGQLGLGVYEDSRIDVQRLVIKGN